MKSVLLAFLFAAALWMGDLYNESKFRHFYPKLRANLLPRGASRWKRVLVYRNQVLKHAGLLILWVGITIGTHLSDSSEAEKSRVFYAASILGFVLYLASRLWPTLVEKPRPRS